MNNNHKKTWLSTSALLVILTGCTTAGGDAHLLDCPPPPILMVNKSSLEFAETRDVCVTSPGKFHIIAIPGKNLDTPITTGQIAVDNKVSSDVDVSGGNTGTNGAYVVEVKVASGATLGAAIEYFIDVDEVAKLDPRVRVIKSNQLAKARLQGIEEILKERFLIDVPELKQILQDAGY